MLTLLVVLLNSTSLAQASGQVRILNDQGLIDENETYHILGEVENTGDAPVTSVNIAATGFDQSGTAVVASSTYADLAVLLPGEKSPFDVMLTRVDLGYDVYNYSLSLTYSAANSVPRTLEFLSNNSYTDSLSGVFVVVGNLTNIGTEVANNVRVIATFFDSKGNVVWVDEEYSEPHDILPSMNASFQVAVPDDIASPLVASYALAAESVQQPIIPETPYFPALLLLILATITIAVLLVVIVYLKARSR